MPAWSGNRQAEAWVLNNLGDALGVTGDPGGIGCLGDRWRSGARSVTGWARCTAASNLADAYQRLGRADEASTCCGGRWT